MIKVVQAYDRAPFADVPPDDADALEIKLEAARRAFLDRDGWLAPYERIEVLRRLANQLGGKVNHFARLIAREGGACRCNGRGHARRRQRPERGGRDEDLRRPGDSNGSDRREHGAHGVHH
jgi:acyl-CoA reductase-like NAD-dependent aldehyde dehydrogenase